MLKGKVVLGIELGSTIIKSVLINEKAEILAKGTYGWSDKLVDGIWSYDLSLVETGLRESYKKLKENYREKYNATLKKVDAIGVSAMMHGYLAFDKNGNLLEPFRTWRNTNTKQSAEELSECFKVNIPMRWSVAQYYQNVLDKKDVKNVDFLTTLSGYVHYKMTGEKVLGIGDASGMFPVKNNDYDTEKLEKFNELLTKHGINTDLKKILPKILLAGQKAGTLSKEGALFLDPTGELSDGIVFCPPEGDMGTGMICTNSVEPETANASLGTSANLTVILDKPLKKFL